MKVLEHSDAQNCAADTDNMLNLIGASDSNPSTASEFIPSARTNPNILHIPNHDYYNMELPEENAFKYVCGYLIKKCTEMHSCEMCIRYVTDNQTVLDDTTVYSAFRAYTTTEENPFGNLQVASNNFCAYVHKLEEIFVKTFENNCFQKHIGAHLFQFAQTVPFQPPCPCFPTVYLIKLFFRMRMYYTLSQHNKECKSVNRKNRKLVNVMHL